MSRRSLIRRSVILAVTGCFLWFSWPFLVQTCAEYRLGHSFTEWDTFMWRIKDADRMDVLVLKWATTDEPPDLSGYDDYHASSTVSLTGAQTEPVTRYWYLLTYSPRSTALCHSPPYGLRFWKNSKVIGEATICWHCSNIFLESSGIEGLYGFDSASGQWLLEELQKMAPLPKK